MAQQHPITPPPELVQQWSDAALAASGMFEVKMKFATYAAQWGADQELEACCEWFNADHELAEELRAARRPKPPSLKEQALALIDECTDPKGDYLDDNALATIRLALQQLPDHE